MGKKITKYMIVGSGLMLLFYFTGLIENTNTSTILNFLLSPSGWQESTFALQAIATLTGIAAVGAIIVGIVTHNIELAVMATFSIYIFNLFWDFLAVTNKVASVNPVLAVIIFGPLMLLFIITIVEFWRGRD